MFSHVLPMGNVWRGESDQHQSGALDHARGTEASRRKPEPRRVRSSRCQTRTAGKKDWGGGRCLEAATGDCCRNARHRPNDFEGSMAKSRSSRAGSIYLHGCRVWFPAEKASDPVRTLPRLFVAVARKSPAAQLKANHVRCWAGTAANSAVLACRSFHRCHESPLTTIWEVC
jgi:hypothetical protein